MIYKVILYSSKYLSFLPSLYKGRTQGTSISYHSKTSFWKVCLWSMPVSLNR